MAINQIYTSNTFQQWLVATQDLIDKANSFDDSSLYAKLAGPTFTGTVTLPSTTSIGSVSKTEISYLDGVTSGIQSQLDLKAPLAGPTFTKTVTVSGTSPTIQFTDTSTNETEFRLVSNQNVFTIQSDIDNNAVWENSFQMVPASNTAFMFGDKLWTQGNDGTGSGLDADLLDGVEGVNYVRTDSRSTVTAGLTINNNNTNSLIIDKSSNTVYSGIQFNINDKANWLLHTHNDGSGDMSLQSRNYTTDGSFKSTIFKVDHSDGNVVFITAPYVGNDKIWSAGNDGTGSGLDADLLDGQHGSYYAPLVSPTFLGSISISGATPIINFRDTDAGQAYFRQLCSGNTFYLQASTGSNDVWDISVLTTNLDTGYMNLYGSKIWTAGNDGTGSGLDADLLDGYQSSTDNTGSTVAIRDSLGDINVRCIKSSFTDQTTISGAMAFRVNTGADPYIRFCSSVSAIRDYLSVVSRNHGHNNIGSLCLCRCTVIVNPGNAVAGSNLYPSTASGSYGSALSGSWICLGIVKVSGDVTLFQRIS